MSSLSAIAIAYNNCDSGTEESESEADSKSDQTQECTTVECLKPSKDYRLATDQTSSSESSSDEESSSDTEDDEISEKSSNEDDCVNSCKRNNTSEVLQRKKEKYEFDDLPPIEELKISVPEVICDPLGEVGWIVNEMVVVRPKAEKPTLNLDSLLFVEKGRRVLGRIFDVFGQVSEPHYCVRFNNSKHVEESDIKVGMTVYYCPNTPYTSLVFMTELLKVKGTDSIGEDEPLEFSDDEEERAYYEKVKQEQKNEMPNAEKNHKMRKRKRFTGSNTLWQSNHPWNSSSKGSNNDRNRRNDYSENEDIHGVRNDTDRQDDSWHRSQPVDKNRWMFPYPPRPMLMQPQMRGPLPLLQFPYAPPPWPHPGVSGSRATWMQPPPPPPGI
ncbi:H/ACA ribonucleoprotein complex non-core subunit NAF1 [Orussus abietinus]|uniref:H/ACA ribonucleoprotein complex non-core subunit NAF1 n=1 Tax=Orussus abietinus TaxID=222816 RepID=UPI000625D426|nr:H/ACA ribonucleoprotein complex non-core subunit NAF1 [Orussus abietinus]